MHWCNLKPLSRGAKLLGAVIVYLWSFSVHAADPVYCASDADIVLTTQGQVDTFQETYGPCDTTLYGVDIVSQSRDILNLDGLSGLKQIQGSLSVRRNYSLGDVSFTALEVIEGDISFENNTDLDRPSSVNFPALISLGGSIRLQNYIYYSLGGFSADALERIDGGLFVQNPNISNLSLAKLTTISGNLDVSNTRLSSLSGLSSLTSVGGSVTILNNGSLRDIDGLLGLTSLGLTTISENGSLLNLSGLANVTAVDGDLILSTNTSLRNLDGLTSLTSVSGAMTVHQNLSLPDLNGVNNLTSISDLTISGNTALRYCGGIYDLLTNDSGVSGTALVSGNGIGCQSVEDVSASLGILQTRASYCYAPSNIVLTTQGQVDTFQETYGPCDTTLYGVDIVSQSRDILNLDGLSGLKQIQGSLSVRRNYSLGDVSFTALEVIEGDISFENNTDLDRPSSVNFPALISLGGSIRLQNYIYYSLGGFSADALERIDGGLFVQNPNISNLSLAKLTTISGNLDVSNTRLSSLSGLSSLTSVGGSVTILNNGSLRDIDGLLGLTSLGLTTISENGSLLNLSGLANVTAVDGDLILSTNTSLRNLDGLTSLTSVSGAMTVHQNLSLPDLNGVNNLTSISDLTISGNTALRYCGGIYDLLTNDSGVSGTALVSGNGIGCQSVEDVSASLGILQTRASYCYAPSNIVLTTQGQVDTFQETYGPCDTTLYGVDIVSQSRDILNLDGLSGLKQIQGSLSVRRNYSLGDVSFTALEVIEGDISFENNTDLDRPSSVNFPALISLGGSIRLQNYIYYSLGGFSADALERIDGGLFVQNPNISNLSLAKLTTISGNLDVSNTRLSSLSGLSSLTSVGGSVTILNNGSLRDIDGLLGLTSLGLTTISENGSLLNLSGLANVTAVDGDLILSTNTSLRNLDGLTSLTSVSGAMTVHQNLSLPDLNGVNNLTSISDLTISGNTALRYCGGIYDLLTNDSGVSGTALVSGNGIGCQSVEDVSASLGILQTRASYCYAPSNIVLTTQGQVDTFQETYGPCDTTLYGVDIVSQSRDILNLDGLSGLKQIQGSLSVRRNYSLGDVSFTALEVIEGDISFENNTDLDRPSSVNFPALISLGGSIRLQNYIYYSLGGFSADALERIDGGLFVQNPNISNLSLAKLTTISGNLDVSNTRLSSLSGLSSLTSVGGSVTILNNGSLRDIDGLLGLTSLGLTTISENGSLLNLSGLANVTAVDGDLILSTNTSLRNLDGLTSLTSVSGAMTVHQNLSLPDLNGVNNLTSISDLTISGNTALRYCGGIYDLLTNDSGVSGTALVSGNGIGCQSVEDVSASLGILQTRASYCYAPSNIVLTTQGQVDTFQETYGPCDTTLYGVDIVSQSRDILNLDGLNGLKQIQGSLTVRLNYSLGDVSFTALEVIEGDISFDTNTDLPRPSSVNFPALISLGGSIRLQNYIYYSLGGFSADALERIDGGLFVQNPNISNLSLAKLTTISGNLDVSNTRLSSLSGLSSLTSVGGSVTILNNGSLLNLSGLANVTAVDGDLILSGNGRLRSIYGLQFLELVTGDLLVTENAVLADCVGLATVLGWPFGFSGVTGDTVIENNVEGCNSVQQILDLTADSDGDGYFDTQDQFPEDAAAAFDNDDDGQPDAWLTGQSSATSASGLVLDEDDDNDGVADTDDAFPFDAAETLDTDDDGIGDNVDTDRDGDGVSNTADAYPNAAVTRLGDVDGDGRPDNCDAGCIAAAADAYHSVNAVRMLDDQDADNDGVPDQIDIAPLDGAIPADGLAKLYFEATGEAIAGPGRNQFSGRYLDLDEDGKTLAIGGLSTVRVFQKQAEGWRQQGAALGSDFGSVQYRRVQLGRDGSTLAISSENYGAPVESGGAGERSGRVQAYQWATDAWTTLGDPIDGAGPGALFGSALAMDQYGVRMAVGAPGDSESAEIGVGSVTIYEYSGEPGDENNKSWQLTGDSTDAASKVWGAVEGGGFGSAVALSRDASVLAVGMIGQQDGAIIPGSVQVFESDADGYQPKGAAISGKTAKESFGRSVALDQLGLTLAVGADGADVNGENSGVVRVYKWNGAAWVQQGSDIRGEAAGDASGTTVDLSLDGTVVVVGAPGNSGNGISSGQARVYAWNNSAWVQRGPDVDGDNATDFSGRTVAISGDGNSFVVGADGNDDGGSNAGQVRMFKTTIEGDPNLDTDEDGVADGNDNCPADANAEQIDTDQDGNGDVCDVDDDNDGYFDNQDTFPLDVTEWADNDADGTGDNADEDDDNDGVKDVDDDFPLDPAQSVNTTDTDGDGVLDKVDNCIAIKNPDQANFDEDAAGDACDADDDNDGVPDLQDAFPFDPDKTEIIFVDTDNDGLEDDADNCPLKQNADQGDFDGDGEGDACDPDDDNDGVADEIDFAPLDASRYLQGRQKAIIVAGGGPYRGNALWPATRSMANFAHKSLESQGVDPSDIWYLSYENNPNVDGAVTRAGIQAAITEWASNPADPADDLLVYFVDHGGERVFELSETEVLTAEDLDGWFDTVEASITGNVAFIYDACQAGSFLPLMTAIEDKQRLVVASTAFDQPALFAADGAISFSYWFWSTFSVTGDIYQSYLRGKNGMGYFQNRQVAQVDVDGDGNGNSKADRQLAAGIRFGDGIVQASDEPVIGSVEGPASVDGASSITLSAVNVQGATRVIRVWAVIDDPDELTGRADEPLIRSEELEFQDDDQDGTWQATYDNLSIEGDYQFIVFAQNESGILSTPSEENPSRLVVTQLKGRAPNIGFDSDRDGYADNNDAFPLDASEYLDTDNDLIGDAADPDADGDGVRDLPDGADAFDEDSSDRPLWLAPGAAAVTRNFHTAIDDDFLQFLAIPGGRYAFRVNPLKDQSSEGIDLVAIVSKSDGSGVTGSSGKLDQGVAGEAESLDFGVTAEDKILIRINDFNRLVGKTTDYALSVALETDALSDTEARVVQDARQRAVIAGKAFDLPLKLFWSGVPSDSALVVWLASQEGVSFSGVTGSSCATRQGFYRCVVPKNGLSGQATINIMVTSASRQTFEVVSYAYVLDAAGQLVPEPGFVDNFQVTRFKAGEDADNDGLNDAFELKNGLSTTVDNSETDQDGDGITDLDEYQGGSDLRTVEQDLDGDGIPNIQDADDDGDGVPDVADAFPLISLDGRTDTDSDGYPDDCDAGCLALDMVADADDDNDGVEDTSDAFALDASETADSDNDGVGDNSDVFPDDATESLDSDSDSIGDNVDNCPSLSNSDQLNTDGDEAGNVCDSDDDNDGFSDDAEAVDGTDPLNRFSCKAGCFSFDVDESQAAQPLTDGLLVIRHLFGFSGDSLTSGAVAGTASRGAPDAIQSYLTAADAELDIDGDGESKPLTDGLLLIRYLFGFTGDSLISGAIGPNATRDTAEKIAAYIEARVPLQ